MKSDLGCDEAWSTLLGFDETRKWVEVFFFFFFFSYLRRALGDPFHAVGW